MWITRSGFHAAGMSPQFKSGGGGAMQWSGYEGWHPPISSVGDAVAVAVGAGDVAVAVAAGAGRVAVGVAVVIDTSP